MPHISLGINLSHDASAAVCVDGVPAIAIASERLCRITHGFPLVRRYHIELPWDSICYCLDYLGIGLDNCDRVVLNKAGGFWDWSLADLRRTIPIRDKSKLVCLESHHEAHAEFVYTASGFDESLVLIIDRFGSFYPGRGYETETGYVVREERFEKLFGNYLNLPAQPFSHFIPEHSLAALYQFVTIAYGFFSVMDECGKTMGLAPFGKKNNENNPWIRLNKNFTLDCSAFYDYFLKEELLDTSPMAAMGFSEQGPRRIRQSSYKQLTPDLAWQIQHETEKIVLEMLRRMMQGNPLKKLCVGGGLFHNSVLNGRILKIAEFDQVFISPAPSDEGNAIGCAYRGCRLDEVLCQPLKTAFLGRDYDRGLIEDNLGADDASYREYSEDELLDMVVTALIDGDVIGWFQGRSEFGFRALGHRSILADPRDPGMRDYINRFVKYREEFRPLGAVVLEEEAIHWFSYPTTSPYMMLVSQCLQPERIPSLIHVNNSTRIQTVDDQGGLMRRLLERFYSTTNVPILINTSFNVSGEPLVESPKEAIASFRKMNLDALVINKFLLRKKDTLV
ncbi:MAG: hypothetical protein JRE64_00595 [Deltaproteobacteria bacterium]|nr:hypothetical protein [Deltaproteobacteria bacterium]